MGDQYGPILVVAKGTDVDRVKTVAIPGKLTTAFLTLNLWLESLGREDVKFVTIPFNEVLEIVQKGEYDGESIDAGLVIHEGQITYETMDLELLVDFGVWWKEQTGLPLPLGANAIRRDLPGPVISDVVRLLHQSIKYALEHRDEALDYALGFGRGLHRSDADKFVGMYVNDWTLDFGEVGRQAVRELLLRAYQAEIVPKRVVPEFV